MVVITTEFQFPSKWKVRHIKPAYFTLQNSRYEKKDWANEWNCIQHFFFTFSAFYFSFISDWIGNDAYY